ncbi:MAG: (2Fe-2S)-binding protein [Polyangiaceae bacterium]|nr:(2Fe-2S)-binding protein [Polyangiaceae bacterium]
MPTFKLDDQDIPFEPGDTVLRAAHRAGVDVPHYCWHPGLSVAANCRMCLVELLPPPGRGALMLDVLRWDPALGEYVKERKPKLVPGCQQPVAEGMEVRSATSEHVTKARSAVQELLLLNHPVDCPICDQAGECRLQDYWLEHQAKSKRMRDEPVHKPKAVRFGPTIVYDAERCIICTRCVRFSAEVAKDPVLSVRERGNLNEIVVAPGRELDHGYTLMTEYVCPVGALTAVDFRFKARVWFLRSAAAVCQGCATGCNAWLDYDPRSHTVFRHRPRENAAVNRWWMCDEGMLDYRRVHEGRVLEAYVDGQPSELDPAVLEAAKRLRGVAPERMGVVLSAQCSNEDNFAMVELARRWIGTGNLYLAGRAGGAADGVLRHEDRNPNAAGARAVASTLDPRAPAELAADIESGKVTHVLALGAELGDPALAGCLETAEQLIALAAWQGPLVGAAGVVLPIASWAESEGTFVNAAGLAQRSEKAIGIQGDAHPAWRVVAAVGRGLGHAMNWRRLADVRRAMDNEAGAIVADAPALEAR